MIVYDLLQRKEVYREQGPNHFDNLAKRVRNSLARRLERMGHKVTLGTARSAGEVVISVGVVQLVCERQIRGRTHC